MAEYGRPQYWNERYQCDPHPFDWYQRWTSLQPVLSEFLDSNFNILVLGCGTSRLSEDMFDAGYTNLTSIDISPVAIKIMSEKFSEPPKASMKFKEMDAMNMPDFPDHHFDVVIDKATLDSLLCGEKATDDVPKMLKEISRVLRDGGRYITISYGQPAYRLTHLQREDNNWTVDIKTVPKPAIPLMSQHAAEKEDVHYVYVCTKSAESEEATLGRDEAME